MDQDQLLTHSRRLLQKTRNAKAQAQKMNSSRFLGLKAEVLEFLRTYAGNKSRFYQEAQTSTVWEPSLTGLLESVLQSFIEYVEAGLKADISPVRQAQLDVVSDFLEQAQRFLADKKVHPAIPAALTGATLEEFLRTWIEAEGISLGNRKPGLQNYATILRDADLITKQDVKDITSWGGLRNHAAHGEWDEVSDKQRVAIMLEGVNLFMRKYGA